MLADQSDGPAQGANTGRNFTNIFFPKPQHSECVVSVSVSDAERSRTSRRECGDLLVVRPSQSGSRWRSGGERHCGRYEAKGKGGWRLNRTAHVGLRKRWGGELR